MGSLDSSALFDIPQGREQQSFVNLTYRECANCWKEISFHRRDHVVGVNLFPCVPLLFVPTASEKLEGVFMPDLSRMARALRFETRVPTFTQKAAGVVAHLTRTLERNFGIGTKHDPAFFAAEGVLVSPALASPRRNVEVQTG
jgi:hypothetical protein